MRISDLNYWHCTWHKTKTTLSKEEFLADSSEFFVFGNGDEWDFKVIGRGELGDTFLKLNKDTISPYDDVEGRNYMAFQLNQELSSLACFGNDNKCGLVLNEKHEPVAVVSDVWNLYYLSYSWRREVYRQDLHIQFYKRILDHIEEEIFITDEYGFIQFMNPHAEKVCGISLEDVIGRHAEDLEKEGIISSSITKEVFKHGEACNKIMEMHTGHTVIASGIPLYDKSGKLINVLATSKDIAELRNILTHLQDVTSELDAKKHQITELKKKIITQDNYVLESAPMQEVEKSIMKVAPTDATVLIEGESGAGKEVIADLLHKLGNRAGKPFVKINCGMIPEHLLESEFFGYEPGAFTGANKNGKKGKIEMADGGTLFFDELGEMPLALQSKILEFLQDREIIRVGGMKRIPIDVRVVAATNRNLSEMVKKGEFRSDLYYRLNVMPIHLSPLRQRSEDILPLTRLFLQKYNARYGKSKTFAPSVLTYFLRYDWPGNVRELMHTVERLLIISDGDVITMNSVNKVLSDEKKIVQAPEITPIKAAKQELELAMVKKAYEIHHSSYKVADLLGVTQPAIMKILKRSGYRLDHGVIVPIEKEPPS